LEDDGAEVDDDGEEVVHGIPVRVEVAVVPSEDEDAVVVQPLQVVLVVVAGQPLPVGVVAEVVPETTDRVVVVARLLPVHVVVVGVGQSADEADERLQNAVFFSPNVVRHGREFHRH
jgi:hypothetical protein